MSHPLAGAVAKCERADRHLETLKADTRAWLARKPEPFVAPAQPNAEHTQAVFIAKTLREPDPAWGLLIGDIAHNLRSALDHVAFSLTLKRTVLPPPKTEFAIFKDPAAFHSFAGPKLAGLTASDRAFIADLQPHLRGDEANTDLLWCLQELDNADKHRVLTTTTTALLREGDNGIAATGVIVTDAVVYADSPVVNGTEVGRVAYTGAVKGTPYDLHLTTTYGVAFGEGVNAKGQRLPTNGQPLIPTLDALVGRVAYIVALARGRVGAA